MTTFDKKPGNLFVYSSVITLLVITALLLALPPVAVALSLAGQALFFALFLNIGLLENGAETWWSAIPSPILILSHMLIVGGGLSLNRGAHSLGTKQIKWGCIISVGSCIPAYLLLIVVLPMAEYDFPENSRWLSSLIVIVPPIYFVVVSALFLSIPILQGDGARTDDSR